MPTRPQAREALRRAGELPDERLDIGELALWFAALDRPEVGLDRYRDHLAELVREVASAAGRAGSAQARAAALREVLAGRFGYEGDRVGYDDLQNANLMRVIDRRRGLPVALGILYLHAARALGWQADGLNFPGHFLIRVDGEGQRAILDPFDGGAERDAVELRELLKVTAGPEAKLTPGHYAATSARGVLLRLQNNVKSRLLRAGDVPGALSCLADMLLLAPEEAGLWREVGLLALHQGDVPRAIDALERFLAVATGDAERHRVAMLLQKLRRQTD